MYGRGVGVAARGPGSRIRGWSVGSAACYRGATVDGSRVFFTSRVELTDDADTGPEDDAANLYECEMSLNTEGVTVE